PVRRQPEEVHRAVPDTAVQAADSPERRRQVRAVLTASRRELSDVAASLYPGLPRVGSTDLLCRPEWLPGAPVELGEPRLAWDDHAPEPPWDITGPASAHVRPTRPDTTGRYASYADAVAALDRPVLFENRPCYRLLGATLTGAPGLRLAGTCYFDGM